MRVVLREKKQFLLFFVRILDRPREIDVHQSANEYHMADSHRQPALKRVHFTLHQTHIFAVYAWNSIELSFHVKASADLGAFTRWHGYGRYGYVIDLAMAGSTGSTLVSSPIITGPDSSQCSQTLTLLHSRYSRPWESRIFPSSLSTF